MGREEGKQYFLPRKGEAINRIWDDYLYSVESVWKSDFKKWRNFCENWEKLLTQIRRKWGKECFKEKGFQTFTLDDKLKTELRFGTDLNRNPDFKLFHRGKVTSALDFPRYLSLSLSLSLPLSPRVIKTWRKLSLNHILNRNKKMTHSPRNAVKKSY